MLPRDLKPEQFSGYPPMARKLATENLQSLQNLPLSFLPSLLRELIEYDYKFPAEGRSLERELANLRSLSESKWKEWFGEFERVQLSFRSRNSTG